MVLHNETTFSVLLIFQRIVSEIIKCNIFILPPESICFLCTPDLFVKMSLLTAWRFLEHKCLFNINHASSQKNVFCLPVLETTTNISLLVPRMEERVLVCLELRMAVVLKVLLAWPIAEPVV